MFERFWNPRAKKPRDFHGEFDRSQAFYVPVNFLFSVGVTTLVCVPGNDRRRKLWIINDSDTTIYLAKGPTAVLNQGIRLNAEGGSLVDQIDAYGYLYRGPWSAISFGAAKNLSIIEE